MNKTRYFPTLPSVRINKISNGTQPKKDVNKSNKKIPIIVLSPGLLLSLLLGACTKAGTTSQTVMPTTSQAASTNQPGNPPGGSQPGNPPSGSPPNGNPPSGGQPGSSSSGDTSSSTVAAYSLKSGSDPFRSDLYCLGRG